MTPDRPTARLVNAAGKGRRNEHRSRALLEAEGYTVIRAAGSKGVFDLVGIGAEGLALVQVKSNRPPSPGERAAMLAFPAPPGCRRLIHVWRDRQRAPDVREL